LAAANVERDVAGFGVAGAAVDVGGVRRESFQGTERQRQALQAGPEGDQREQDQRPAVGREQTAERQAAPEGVERETDRAQRDEEDQQGLGPGAVAGQWQRGPDEQEGPENESAVREGGTGFGHVDLLPECAAKILPVK